MKVRVRASQDPVVEGTCNLFTGVTAGLLVPFHYFGIWDESVNYKEIPWRNGRFDPEQLTNKLATLARARHAPAQWRNKAQKRTLAFCVSVRHADYMAEQFRKNGVAAASVHSSSDVSRGAALAQLADRRLPVLFSVDLFSEGVDLPAIDTALCVAIGRPIWPFRPSCEKRWRRAKGAGKSRTLGCLKLPACNRTGAAMTAVF